MSIPLLDTFNIPTGILTSTTSELLLARDTDGDVKLFNGASYLRGTGTTNRLAKFTGANSLGDSIIQDDGTGVFIQGSLGVGVSNYTAAVPIRFRASLNQATSIGFLVDPLITSSVTSSATGIRSAIVLSSNVTLPTLNIFEASTITIGSDSTISTVNVFTTPSFGSTSINSVRSYVSTQNAATGLDRWALYMAGTALNYLRGGLLLNTTSNTGEQLIVNGNARITTMATGTSTDEVVTVTSSGLLNKRTVTALLGNVNGITGTGTVNRLAKFTGTNTLGDSLIQDDGVRVGIVSAPSANRIVNVGGNISGNSSLSFGVHLQSNVSNSVTGSAVGFRTAIGTESGGTTLSTLVHYSTDAIAFSTPVTTQIGFQASSSLISATNNYGFRGLLAAGTGRWNLFMDGTASNYLAGRLLIGTTTDNERLLQVHGQVSVRAINASNIASMTTSAIRIINNSVSSAAHSWISQLTAGGNGFSLGTIGETFRIIWASAENINAPSNTVTALLLMTSTSITLGSAGITTVVNNKLLVNTPITSDSGERLQVNGNIKQTSVTNNLLFADSTGVLTAYANTASIALGTGTGGYIVRYSGTGATQNIGNSVLFQNGSNIGLNTTTPAYRLDINGTLGVSNTLTIYSGTSPSKLDITTNTNGVISTYTNNSINVLGNTNSFIISNSNFLPSGGSGYRVQIDSGTTGGNGLFVRGNIYSTATITSFSDIRLKSELEKIENAIDKIKKISGYTYLFNEKRTLGLISQEVKNIAPEAIEEKGGYMTLNYQGFSAVIVEAIKELSNEIQKLKEKCQ